jgi:excisionase family DNA binding protein
MPASVDFTLRSNHGFITAKSLSKILSVHYQTLYGWVSDGLIPYTRVGSRIKFEGIIVADWLQSRRVG